MKNTISLFACAGRNYVSPMIALTVLLAAASGHLAAQQQNLDEVPGVGVDRNSDFGNDTNYGLVPRIPTESFDSRVNPTGYPRPEQVNRNTISTSLIGLAQGFLYIEWEHLIGRMFGFTLGGTFYASEISQTRRLFQPAGFDNNSFMNLGAMFGFTFYVSQQYVQGLAIQLKLGGGLLSGSYLQGEQGESEDPLNMRDFYGSLFVNISYRINVTRNIALSPILVVNPNVLILINNYDNPLIVPSFFRINGHSDLLTLSAPADLTGGGGRLLLFMHVGIGVDLTFTF